MEFMSVYPMAEKQEIVQPEQLHFKDDGVYPGSVLPVLLYRAAIIADAHDRASVLERGFAQNDWRNSWRNGVYSFAHYHSTSHEVLGVYDGFAKCNGRECRLLTNDCNCKKSRSGRSDLIFEDEINTEISRHKISRDA